MEQSEVSALPVAYTSNTQFWLQKAWQRVSSLIWMLPVVWWIYWGALYCLVLRNVNIVPDKSIDVLSRPWTSFVLGLWRISKFARKSSIKTKIFHQRTIDIETSIWLFDKFFKILLQQLSCFLNDGFGCYLLFLQWIISNESTGPVLLLTIVRD